MISQRKCIITTSWDDGHTLDEKLARILQDYSIKATFYVPKCSKYRSLSDNCVRNLAQYFEIGAHSLTHPNLTTLDDKSLYSEIQDSKNYIESITGNSCQMFCYPNGVVNERVRTFVMMAGFAGARTTISLCNPRIGDPYMLHTTMQVCSYSKKKTQLHVPGKYSTSIDHLIDLSRISEKPDGTYSWVEFACHTFDIIYNIGGVWHLWGHTWEIEKSKLWTELGEVFGYIMSQEGIDSQTNGEVISSLL